MLDKVWKILNLKVRSELTHKMRKEQGLRKITVALPLIIIERSWTLEAIEILGLRQFLQIAL